MEGEADSWDFGVGKRHGAVNFLFVHEDNLAVIWLPKIKIHLNTLSNRQACFVRNLVSSFCMEAVTKE